MFDAPALETPSTPRASLGDPTAAAPEARETYERDGYFVCRGLVSGDAIDTLLDAYRRRLLPSKKPYFRQSTGRWEPNRLSPYGYVTNSFLDVHDLADPDAQEVCRAARAVFCSVALRSALTALTGQPQHSLMQSMLFDQNAATPAHQDAWFLDSTPNGHLLAGWFALEDIDARAGRFYVLPGSHRVQLALSPDEQLSVPAFTARVTEYVEEHRNELVAPALRKGDVLFWSSTTIHGSLPTQDPRYSRKSLTAHYMPSQFGFGNNLGDHYDTLYRLEHGMPYRAALQASDPVTRLLGNGYAYLARRNQRLLRVLRSARRVVNQRLGRR